MKRSEMVRIMSIHFYESGSEPEDSVEEAEACLKAMEEAGMMPPCLPDDQCQELMKKYVDPSFNEWESEDEA